MFFPHVGAADEFGKRRALARCPRFGVSFRGRPITALRRSGRGMAAASRLATGRKRQRLLKAWNLVDWHYRSHRSAILCKHDPYPLCLDAAAQLRQLCTGPCQGDLKIHSFLSVLAQQGGYCTTCKPKSQLPFAQPQTLCAFIACRSDSGREPEARCERPRLASGVRKGRPAPVDHSRLRWFARLTRSPK